MDDTVKFVLIIALVIFLLFMLMYNRYEENFEPTYDAATDLQRMMSAFEVFRQRMNVPAMQVNVMKDGVKTFGSNHSAKDVQIWDTTVDINVQDNTLFRIASVTKPITAIAILHLVNDGKLGLDDNMVDILVRGNVIDASTIIDPRMNDITVRDLLRHSGGWDTEMGLNLSTPFAATLFPELINDKTIAPFDPQYDALKLASPDGVGIASATDVIKFMMNFPLNFAPGTREKYSNLGYNILGRIIEVISGEPYATYIQNYIFGPANFEYPSFIGDVQIGNKHLDEVYYYDGPQDNVEYSVVPGVTYKVPSSYGSYILQVMDAHGGWVMTATDLSKVGAKMLNLDYFSQTIFDEILQRPSYVDANDPTFYSLGMSVTNMPDGDTMLSHNGALTFGTFGFLGMMIQKKLVLSVITNHIEYDIGAFLGSFTSLVTNLFAKK